MSALEPAMRQAGAERFLDSGDHTTVVDPIKRDHWIYDGYNKFEQSQRRGLTYDFVAFARALGWEKADKGTPLPYNPNTRELDALNKWTNPPAGVNCPGHHQVPRHGLLPTISSLLYDNALPNKSVGDISHEMREADRRQAHRIFDTSGFTR